MPVPTAKETFVDVLIIGAGPAGVMCANALARAGVNVKIVDKRAASVLAGQADGIQPRTIEVFQSYGLAERLLREGNQMHMVAFYNPSPDGGLERTGRAADAPAPTARYPYKITLHQGAIEQIFLDSMAQEDLRVDRETVPISIKVTGDEAELRDSQAHAVTVVLQHLDAEPGADTEVVRAKYVLGSDGAHSWVRKTFGITMDGEQTNFVWGVVDVVPDTDFPDIRNRCAIHSHNGSCMVVPREGDKVRLYVQLAGASDAVDPATGRIDRSRIGPHELMQVAKKTFAPYRIDADTFDWWTIYIIGQRVASKFSVNERVFIAGDACHTHSPKAGQGMNASMNDTHNLAWKLAYVLRGWSDLSLLKTYELERRKYAQELINFDKDFSALFSGKPRTKDNQEGVSHEQFLEAFNAYGGFTSGTNVHYPPSAIVNEAHQQLARNLVIGERMLPHVFICAADARPFDIQDFLPADTRFKVLVFLGDVGNRQQLARVHRFAEDVASSKAFYRKFGGDDPAKVFDIVSIGSGRKHEVNYTDVPLPLRTHWSKVLLDDTDMFDRCGGGGYDKYGIDPLAGAIVVVRPDGYVGAVSSFEDLTAIEGYFAGFLTAH
ncbi:phenol 2-monooxygenase [Phanerochaete sordida]|uniref:Phenol 2-monooxygenase n=1 Tax=Phanerochaete sordida TaxID=48140 RepID=A0A9P3LAP2_9APHY|nr:phenol 2-monooxygenase [Phanerochaete sordida]